MSTTLRLKTNLNCQSCVSAVKPYLDRLSNVRRWGVDISSADKTLTVEGEGISAGAIQAEVQRAGFEVLGTIESDSAAETKASLEETPTSKTYFPLLLLVSFLLGLVAVAEIRSGGFAWERAMQNFMGAFFVAFAFFKLLDVRGFADTYRMYDIVAKRFPIYGTIYPFVELALGVAYLTNVYPIATNVATLAVMSVSIVGVVQSVLQKRKIRCACLGTFFNLPMSTVTLVEDASMIIMAAGMLLFGSH